MENVNPYGPAIPQNTPRDQTVQKLDELLEISAMIDSRLENIDNNQIIIPSLASPKQLLNDFMNPSDFLKMNNLESDVQFEDTPFVSPFLDMDDESDDGEVMDFTVLEDKGEYIESELSEVVIGKPFKGLTQLEDNSSEGLISFNSVWDTYIYHMPLMVILDNESSGALRIFTWTILR
nr:hypothetical protein [Tanacetum cinerariifolium]